MRVQKVWSLLGAVALVLTVAAPALSGAGTGGGQCGPDEVYVGQQPVYIDGEFAGYAIICQKQAGDGIDTGSGIARADAGSELGQRLQDSGWADNGSGQVELRSGAPDGAGVGWESHPGDPNSGYWQDVPAGMDGYLGGGQINITTPPPGQGDPGVPTGGDVGGGADPGGGGGSVENPGSNGGGGGDNPGSSGGGSADPPGGGTGGGTGGGGDSPPLPPPACDPDSDRRSLTLTLEQPVTRAPGLVTASVVTRGTVVGGTVQVTASYGLVVTATDHGGGRWTALVPVPAGLKGPATATASARLRQSDGCGSSYGPNTFTMSAEFQIIPAGPNEEEGPAEEHLVPANLALDQYLELCLGYVEPWYCGIDANMAAGYVTQLSARREYYAAALGVEKWTRLVQRIDAALGAAGAPPSGLATPAEP